MYIIDIYIVLFVIESPKWGPKLVSDRSWYGVGSTLRATCASPPAHPPANLTFALNGQEVSYTVYSLKKYINTSIQKHLKI